MTTPVLMPQMGLEVSEATVLAVLVAVGDRVSAEQSMFEIETEKAVSEVGAPCDGYVVRLDVAEGDTVAVGAVLGHLGERPGIAPSAEQAAGRNGALAERSNPAPPGIHAAGGAAVLSVGDGPARRRVAPVARRAAVALGVDLDSLAGTGPRGRITLRDVEHAAADGSGTAGARSELVTPQDAARATLQPLSKVRRITARRMTQSQLIPQYHLTRDVDASHLLAQKSAAAAATSGGSRPGLNDLLIQAIARMVTEHADLALRFVETPEVGLWRHETIGVGLAVASDHGLVVPVIRAAEELGLADIAAERSRLVAAARAGRLSLEEMTGAAITLSNLGGFGVDRFTAMLNPGESAIVAVGRIIERVVPRERGIAVIPMLTVTVSFDHRAVDGAVGGAALAGLAELLEGRMVWRP